MLARFFKPKWQHHKAEVRLRAIDKLSADDPSTGEILAQLALQDQDAEVRRAALNRTEDSTLLLRASEEDSVEHNRLTALQRITHLVSGELGQLDCEQRQALLPRIQSTELLVHLTLNASAEELRQQALDLLDDESVLLDIIRQSERTEIRIRAAERISAAPQLEQLERDSRGKDKRLYRIARDKLQQLREQAQQRNARQQRRDELSQSLQQLARGEDFPQFGAKLDALDVEWRRYNSDASSDEQSQWQTLYTQCQQRREQLDQQRQAEAAELARKQAQQQRIDQLVSTLEQTQTLDELTVLEQQWQQLQADASQATDRHVRQLLSENQQLLNAQQSLQSQQDELRELSATIEASLDEAGPGQLKKWQKQSDRLSNAINWPADQPVPAALKQLGKLQSSLAQAIKARQAQRDAISQQIDETLDQLSLQIDAGEARQADKQHTLVQKRQAEFNQAQQQRYRTLFARLQELRDWQGYALTPKREALCNRMEALIDSDLPAQELADEIRQLQQQWRALDQSGNVHSRGLWQRFKKASDLAYQPCDAHYAQQRELRQQNLLNREQMCEQLDAYLSQVDWEDADWRAVEEISRTAKNEWRQYSPVDRAPGKVLQTRFNKQINTLESRLKNRRKAVQEVKEALLAESAQLLDAEDLQQATDQAKQLQQQWREAGTTFRAQERRLWSEFRDNCNRLFEKRNADQQQVRQQQRQDQSRLKQLCDALEDLHQRTSALASAELAAELNQLDTQYQTLVSQESSLNTAQQKQYQQLSALIHARLNQRQQLFGDNYEALKQRDSICQQIEDSLLADTDADISALQDAWQQTAAISNQWHSAMNSRYEQACSLADPEQNSDELIQAQSEAMRELCIRLEIALGEPSPVEDEALRLEYQMQRLQQALRRQQDGYDMTDIQQLVFERLCLPCYHHHADLNARFNELLAGYNLN